MQYFYFVLTSDFLRIHKDEHCNLYYQDLIDFLDRTKCPLADIVPINIKVTKFMHIGIKSVSNKFQHR